jgi:membrane associated rhomboid family serine protease
MQTRLESTHRWAQTRMHDQVASRAQVELIVIGSCDKVSPVATARELEIGAVSVDPSNGAVSELLPLARALPSSREIEGICKTVARSGQAPTLAAVDLAERQMMTGSSAGSKARAAINERPLATYVLLGAIAFFYALQQVHFGFQTITGFWQLPTGNLGISNWWTVVTYGFLHAGLTHIAFNAWAIYVLGSLIERMYGRLALLGTFFAAVIGGALLSVGAALVSAINPGTVVVGASGGVFGLVGLLLMMGKVQGKGVPPQFSSSLRSQMWFVVLINLGMGVLIPGISLTGHVGGFAVGVLLGLVLPPRVEIGGATLSLTARALLALVVGVSALALLGGIFTVFVAFLPSLAR